MLRKQNKGRQFGFFSMEERHEKLISISQTLDDLNKLIPWERFRPLFSRMYKNDEVKGGRPPYDEVMMFKCVILQHLYNLSDEQLEYQILDRLSFMKFLDMTIASSVPDHNTIWGFREKLKKHNLTRQLFLLFESYLLESGFKIHGGFITDATFVEVPKQRNTREENEAIKNNEMPESFEKKTPQQLAHKDRDARWAKKNDQNYYGYKDHITVDAGNKFILDYKVTSASVHDSVPFFNILPEDGENKVIIYADSAYRSQEIESQLKQQNIQSEICEKGYRDTPLTEEQIQENHRKSKTRSRVEHIFGDIKNRARGFLVRTIGKARAEVKIGLYNMAYNMRRMLTLTKSGKESF